ncbi:MAG: flagellar filament capping protein FliD [Alphaproteobacteria bacterium]|nr:flagellar filament capping protein FliD [Alphaproteobacteria bacterium]
MATTNGITTLGSRTFLFGAASGIDTSALVTAAYNARKVEADKIDIQVKNNTAKYEAYDKIRSLSNAVQTSLSNIKKNYSVLSDNKAMFDQRAGALSTNTSVSAAALIDVKLDPGTDIGAYELTIEKKGQAHRVASSTSGSATVPLGFVGDFSIGVAGKAATSVSVTAGMTLTDLAAAINTGTQTSGVKATIAKVSATQYELVLTGSDINKEIEITGISGDNVMRNIGVTDAGGAFVTELQVAQPAVVNLDGISYSRDTNSITDLIPGATINVKNADPGTKINLSIENDNSAVKSGIQDFMEAYNNLRDFIKSQQVVSDGGVVSESAVLFGDSILSNLSGSLQSIIGGSYGAGGSNLATLRGVGITLDQNNKLVMDETIFDTATIDKFEQVRDIFQTKVTVDNSEFRMSKNTSTSGAQSFAMQITMSGPTISSVSVGGDTNLFDISGTTITGKVGTVYEGMSFAYIGTANTTVNIGVQPGLADSLDVSLSKFTDILTGDLSKEMARITSQNTLLADRSARVLERAGAYRDSLINKYANFEAKLAQAQTVLAQLRALTGSDNSNNN